MKQFTGEVISTKTPKTAIVKVTQRWMHPVYKKIVKRTKQFACDTAEMSVKEGDMVTIVETRPISKTKHFKVVPTEVSAK